MVLTVEECWNMLECCGGKLALVAVAIQYGYAYEH